MLRDTLKTMTVRHWLGVILLLAVGARLAFLVLFGHTLSLETSGYDTYAVNLLDGQGFTRFEAGHGDSDLPPLYVYFLAGVYRLLGRDPVAVALAQTVLDALSILVIFAIGRRVSGPMTGLLAAAFYGLYPYLLFQNLTVNDTGLFILLLVLGIWLAYRVRDSRRWTDVAALGVVFGLGALTKTLILLVLPLLVLWWWRRAGLTAALRLGLVAGVALLIVVAPWAVRNTRLHNALVLVSTNGGSNLHQGNNLCVADYLARGWDAQWVNCLEPTPPDLSEVEADAWHRRQALDYLRDNPGAWPRLFGTKLWVLWSPAIMPYDLPPDPHLVDDTVFQYHTPEFEAARIVHLLTYTPLLALGVAGATLAWRDRLEIGPLLAVIAAITVTYVLFHPSTRYRAPADPFVFVFAAYALARVWTAQLAPRWHRAADSA